MFPWTYTQNMQYNAASFNGSGNNVVDASAKSFLFQRYLWQRLIGVIKWNIPSTWNYDYFTYCLYMYGYVSVILTDKFGVIPQQCGLAGYDVFYAPNKCVISNPLLRGILEPRIGVDCEIIHINADYGGMWDLITYYADLLANVSSAIGVNIINSKLAYLLVAGNKSQSETLKEMYKQISGGQPAVVIDSDMLTRDGAPKWLLFDTHVGANYITDRLLVDYAKILNQFDTEIGIPNANTEKKERMIVDETNANNIATAMGTETRLERLQRDAKKVEKMFGITCWPEWRYDPMDTGMEVGGINGNSNRGNNNI